MKSRTKFLLSLLSLALLSVNIASAQSESSFSLKDEKLSIKAQAFYGSYLDQNYHFEKFRPFAPYGLNLALELPSTQQLPWQQYLNNPTVGLGLTLIDFDQELMGGAINLYPYILIPTVRNKVFELNLKVAAGLAFVTKHWHNLGVDPDNYEYYSPEVNTIFGSYLNAYLSAGLDLRVPITKALALNGEFGYFHMCNGRTAMPNVGANVLYGGVGVIKTFNATKEKEAMQFPDRPYQWSLNVTASGGVHKAWIYYPSYPIASFHTGAVYHVNNWYGVGLGVDAFYNGAIDKGTGRSLYRQDREYSTTDKIRAGVALNNEFKFGEITALLDWGVYLYNPSRNYYDNDHPIYGYGKRPLFYKNDGAGTDEAFHYWRMGAKVRVWDNVHLQILAKNHLHVCEYVEFGLNYQIPFLKKSNRKPGQSAVYHHHHNWWLN